jgi:hypothetical protein
MFEVSMPTYLWMDLRKRIEELKYPGEIWTRDHLHTEGRAKHWVRAVSEEYKGNIYVGVRGDGEMSFVWLINIIYWNAS